MSRNSKPRRPLQRPGRGSRSQERWGAEPRRQKSSGAFAPVDTVLSRLRGVRGRSPKWTALCPAHNDRTPSLSVGLGHDGRVLLHCFAQKGCTAETICTALGLKESDLFVGEENSWPRRFGPKRSVFDSPGRESRSPANHVGPEELAPCPDSLKRAHATSLETLRRRGLPPTLQQRGLGVDLAVQMGLGRRGDDAVIPLRRWCGELVNLKYRLTDKTRGKYRYHLSGQDNPPWMSPNEDWEGRYIDVFEGEKGVTFGGSDIVEVALVAFDEVPGVDGAVTAFARDVTSHTRDTVNFILRVYHVVES